MRGHLIIVLCLGSVPAMHASAADVCCPSCGCRQPAHKICRLVCDTEKVTKVVYDCRCEDFCVPGPSCRCGSAPSSGCQGCANCPHHALWQPTSARIHTRKVLVKRELVEERPRYTWVIEEACRQCGHCSAPSEQPAAVRPAGQVVPASAAVPFEPPPDQRGAQGSLLPLLLGR